MNFPGGSAIKVCYMGKKDHPHRFTGVRTMVIFAKVISVVADQHCGAPTQNYMEMKKMDHEGARVPSASHPWSRNCSAEIKTKSTTPTIIPIHSVTNRSI